jgi:hypothetical protein
LCNKNKYSKILQTDEEKWVEISTRRNAIEPDLRKIVKMNLKSSKGEVAAKAAVLNAMLPNIKVKYQNLSYNDLFDPKKSEVYFSLMSRVIELNWSIFENLFNNDKKMFLAYTAIINKYRADCHATSISNDEMNSFRGAMSWVEDRINDLT